MKFSLEIELGNEAMQSAGDVAEALRESATRIGIGQFSPDGETGRIYDVNGNTVGRWQVVE